MFDFCTGAATSLSTPIDIFYLTLFSPCHHNNRTPEQFHKNPHLLNAPHVVLNPGNITHWLLPWWWVLVFCYSAKCLFKGGSVSTVDPLLLVLQNKMKRQRRQACIRACCLTTSNWPLLIFLKRCQHHCKVQNYRTCTVGWSLCGSQNIWHPRNHAPSCFVAFFKRLLPRCCQVDFLCSVRVMLSTLNNAQHWFECSV